MNFSDIFKFHKLSESQIEKAAAMELFKSDCNCNLPQTIGAIEETQIFIQTPENERKFNWYCRK